MINTKPSQQRLCNACIKYHNLTFGVSKSDINIMIFFALTFFVSTIDEPCSCSADAKAQPHNTVALLALHWKIGFPSPHDLGCAKKKTVFDPTFHQFCYPRNFEHRIALPNTQLRANQYSLAFSKKNLSLCTLLE